MGNIERHGSNLPFAEFDDEKSIGDEGREAVHTRDRYERVAIDGNRSLGVLTSVVDIEPDAETLVDCGTAGAGWRERDGPILNELIVVGYDSIELDVDAVGHVRLR